MEQVMWKFGVELRLLVAWGPPCVALLIKLFELLHLCKAVSLLTAGPLHLYTCEERLKRKYVLFEVNI